MGRLGGFKLHQYSILNNGVGPIIPTQCLIWIYVSGQKPLYPFSGVTGHKLRATGGQMNAEVTEKHSSTLCISCMCIFVSTAVTTYSKLIMHVTLYCTKSTE